MRWAGHVERTGEARCADTDLMGKPERKRPLGRPGRGRIILKWIFKKWNGCMDWIDLTLDKENEELLRMQQ